MRRTVWFLGLLISNAACAHGLKATAATSNPSVASREVIEPPATNYPATEFAKVAVLQWTHRDFAPMPATTAQAEAYKAINRADLTEYIVQAKRQGAELIMTPEFGVTGYPETADGEHQFKAPEEVAPYVETIPGPSTQYFGELSQRLGIWIGFSLAEKGADGNYYNAAVLVDAEGKVRLVHRKRNLFGSERKFLKAGQDAQVIETPFGRMGMMICADVYHSATLNDFKKRAPESVLVSAAWTVHDSAVHSFRAAARTLGSTVVASNLADFPDSGVFNGDGSTQSHIRETKGLAFGYLKRQRRGNEGELKGIPIRASRSAYYSR
jgi:predicted amidohydrolase